MVYGVVRAEPRVLSLSQWRKVGLPLALWQEFGPNFKGLPKANGVATNHWVFSRFSLKECICHTILNEGERIFQRTVDIYGKWIKV